ncbi:MAG: ABC transporter ATP-binding protein [Chlorobiaceae bacterium]|nr:ABC transporter ATP-binding protein [Chlorobiaceae bacterium]
MQALLKLLQFLRPHWRFAVMAPVLMLCEVVLDLMQPRLIQRIIDYGVARSDTQVVLGTASLMLCFMALAGLSGLGCGYFAVRAAYGLGGDLRAALFRKVQSLSFGNLDNLETGALITRLTSDVNKIQEMVMMMMRGMVRMPLLMLGSLVMAAVISPRLGLIFIVILPALTIALIMIIRKTFPLYRQVQEGLDGVNTVMQENLAGVRVVKAFARTEYESRRFALANNILVQRMTDAVRMSSRTTPVMMLTLNVGVVAALWIGAGEVQMAGMRVGELVAFINYLGQAVITLMMFSTLTIQISTAQASAKRVLELLESEPILMSPGHEIKFASRPSGKVVFDNVSFNYSPANPDLVLKNISFEAEPGQTVAILGATGSGKSTLVQLIPRFYDVCQGSVTLDGVDVRKIPEEELRRHVGIALQESILFSTSIKNNIRLGEPDASFEKLSTAARNAQADEFISKLPDGYEALVGQRGVNLSGGQKQRLAIARALLVQPSVLILDDSTSAVDVHTEGLIQEVLGLNSYRQTRFIVAQRISSVLNADKILVLDNGEIIAQGTHYELLDACEVYREIYDSQTENGVITYSGN